MAAARILAVDDQRYFRELLEGMLTDEGFAVQTASSAEEALRVLEHSLFDVVLTDLVMPGMDGSELVHRIKERFPDQHVVVVTGVVDVKTAVEAMKLGATDYLLKPFDRETLAACLAGILQRQRLHDENERLLAENIEYIGVLSLMERSLEFFSCLSVDALAERIVEGVCVEAGAQGGVLWVAAGTDGEDDELRLAAARGLVRAADETERFPLSAVPPDLWEDGARATGIVAGQGGPAGPRTGAALLLPMRHNGVIVGLLRLTDRLGGDAFEDEDRIAAAKLVRFGSVALFNALRFRGVERDSVRDPSTHAYSFEYFEDAIRSEIEKSNRFQRRFSLLRVEIGSLDGIRSRLGDAEVEPWLRGAVKHLAPLLRSSDLLAADGRGAYAILLPEADALSASTLKLRVRDALERSELMGSVEPAARPCVYVATVTYPTDGSQTEALGRALIARIAEDRRSPARALGLDELSLDESLRILLEQGEPAATHIPEQIARFTLAQIARRPRERSLLFVAPQQALRASVHEGLEALCGVESATEIVLIEDGERMPLAEAPVTWASPQPSPTRIPFLVRCGEGPAYALLCDEKSGSGSRRIFHTSDRSLVEHLAFRLQRELGLPRSEARREVS